MLHRFFAITLFFVSSFSFAAIAQGNSIIAQTPEEIVDDLRDTAGTPRAVMIFASWCSTCRLDMPEMIELGEEYPDSLIVVSIDEDEEALEKYVSTLDDVPFDIVLNQDEEWMLASEMKERLLVKTWKGVPNMVLFNSQNQIVDEGPISPRRVGQFLSE